MGDKLHGKYTLSHAYGLDYLDAGERLHKIAGELPLNSRASRETEKVASRYQDAGIYLDKRSSRSKGYKNLNHKEALKHESHGLDPKGNSVTSRSHIRAKEDDAQERFNRGED